MKPIYWNFDGLDVSFQGAVPVSLRNVLHEAKYEAQQSRGNVLAKIGSNKRPVLVAETGAKGGYAFRFDTGPDGETWFIADNNDPARWNIRVSVKSLTLALYGYEKVKERLLSFLGEIGATGPITVCPSTGKSINNVKERVSRVDFCVDFETDHFEPDVRFIVAHSRCTRRTISSLPALPVEDIKRGRDTESLRIGAMPGRQVTLYDKTREIKVHNKSFWWNLWGIDPKTFEGQIWRIETRAGKEELDKWNLRTFVDFETRICTVITAILEAIRYVKECPSDCNMSRWPMESFWQETIETARKALLPYSSKAERKKIITDLRENLINVFRGIMPGLMASYTVILGKDISQISEVLDLIAGDISAMREKDPMVLPRKYQKAVDRYIFLQEESEDF